MFQNCDLVYTDTSKNRTLGNCNIKTYGITSQLLCNSPQNYIEHYGPICGSSAGDSYTGIIVAWSLTTRPVHAGKGWICSFCLFVLWGIAFSYGTRFSSAPSSMSKSKLNDMRSSKAQLRYKHIRVVFINIKTWVIAMGCISAINKYLLA